MTKSESGLHWIFPLGTLIVLVLIFVALHFLRTPEPATPLDRALIWIASRQNDDGSWHGEEIAVLRPGPAMTAFVLYAMTRLPEPLRAQFGENIKRAVTYLEKCIDKDGMVGATSDGIDYPNYATSLTVLSFTALKKQDSVDRMVDYLKRAQLDEGEGWTTSDPEYGGWAFGGPSQPKPNAHRLDISMTRFALEGLAAARVPAEDVAWSKARRFLEGCQNKDGGFIFTPLTEQSKAGERVSYGSATADGLLCLRAAGASKERIDAAEQWIRSRFTAEHCPGFAANAQRPWAAGLLGYWLAASARSADASQRDWIRTVLISRQRSDGSWVNSTDVMLENEPLLATTLGVLALSEVAR